MDRASRVLHNSGRRDGTFLLALSVMCVAALAVGSILLSRFIGGSDYVNSFYGKYAMAILAVAFVVSAYYYNLAKKQLD